jgi:hypothetical protein
MIKLIEKIKDQERIKDREKSTLPFRVFYAFKFQHELVKQGLFNMVDFKTYLKED